MAHARSPFPPTNCKRRSSGTGTGTGTERSLADSGTRPREAEPAPAPRRRRGPSRVASARREARGRTPPAPPRPRPRRCARPSLARRERHEQNGQERDEDSCRARRERGRGPQERDGEPGRRCDEHRRTREIDVRRVEPCDVARRRQPRAVHRQVRRERPAGAERVARRVEDGQRHDDGAERQRDELRVPRAARAAGRSLARPRARAPRLRPAPPPRSTAWRPAREAFPRLLRRRAPP